MPRADYFHDGYTQNGFIAAAPQLHGPLHSPFARRWWKNAVD